MLLNQRDSLLISFVILAVGAGIMCSEGQIRSPNDTSDYYQAWDCKGWDNTKLVADIVWDFYCPPQVGVQDWLTTYITPRKDTYLSSITLSVKLGGV